MGTSSQVAGQDNPSDCQTVTTIVVVFGCPQVRNGNTLLLKITYALVTGHGGNKFNSNQ